MLQPRHKLAGDWIREHTPREATFYADPLGLAYWVGALGHRDWTGRWSAPYPGKQAEWDATGCILGLIECDGPPPSPFDYYVTDYAVDVPWLRAVYSDQGVNVYEMVY
jgi:hypothetical protein